MQTINTFSSQSKYVYFNGFGKKKLLPFARHNNDVPKCPLSRLQAVNPAKNVFFPICSIRGVILPVRRGGLLYEVSSGKQTKFLRNLPILMEQLVPILL